MVSKTCTLGELSEIVEARFEEIFLLVGRRVAHLDPARELGAGVVLAGGGAYQRGIEAKAREVLGLPARRASVDLEGTDPARAFGPEHALGAGLLRWSLAVMLHERAVRGEREHGPVRWITGAFRWLAEGF